MFFDTDTDNGKTQVLNFVPNGIFDILLSANPTTGYCWSWGKIHGDVIEIMEQITYTSSEPITVGSGGICVASLRLLKHGLTTIILEYKRPWNNEIAKTFTLHLDIQ